MAKAAQVIAEQARPVLRVKRKLRREIVILPSFLRCPHIGEGRMIDLPITAI
jgi:hypothetical protein